MARTMRPDTDGCPLQQKVLLSIYGNVNQTHSQIAREVGVATGTIPNVLKGLQRKGFIDRIPNKTFANLLMTEAGALEAERIGDFDD
jgi:DNA-binding MarR family transcriptional regulator